MSWHVTLPTKGTLRWWWTFFGTRAKISSSRRSMCSRCVTKRAAVYISFLLLHAHILGLGDVLAPDCSLIGVCSWYLCKFPQVFVANPKKPPQIESILRRNKEKLLAFLKNFHNDKEGEQWLAWSKDEMKIVLIMFAALFRRAIYRKLSHTNVSTHSNFFCI